MPISPDVLIDEQEQLLEFIKVAKKEAQDEQIQVVPIYEAKKSAFNYEFEPMYLVNYQKQDGQEDLHLVYDWKTCQSSIKCFSQEEQEYYKRKYKEGIMLEPKRKIYVTDRQLEITEKALQSALTDGMIEQLRQKYILGLVPKNTTDDQRKVFDNFIKHTPFYSIVILNQDGKTNKQEFQKEHLLPNKVKVHKRPNDTLKDLCSIILNFQEIAIYKNFQQYFIEKGFEVLINQKFNKTQQILDVLRELYKSQFENKKDIQEQPKLAKKSENSSSNKIQNSQKEGCEGDANAEIDENYNCLEGREIEIEQIQQPEKQDISFENQKQNESLTTEEININSILQNINMVIESSSKQIKQQFRFSKGSFSVLQLKTEFENFHSQISLFKANNQEYHLLAQKFLIKFPIKPIKNTLQSICRDYKIDEHKLII